MRPETFSSDSIVRLLRRRTVATMGELKSALGSSIDITVFRKLRTIPYVTSYSHQGRYYALREVGRYDERGLWNWRGVHFSLAGSLVDTVEAFVRRAVRGCRASELASQLEVEVQQPLRKLVRAGRLFREESSGMFLYCAAEPDRRQAQLAAHHAALVSPDGAPTAGHAPEELKATIILFLGMLDEKQRRIFAGLESLRLGPRGDALVAATLGLDPATVAKGRDELRRGEGLDGPIRRRGAGRKPVEKKGLKSSCGSKRS